jgi:UDP-N-acetylglucosamine:LPS N-acetylglucosamine transferase
VRVLIFSADIGEGHDAPARELRAGILELDPGADVSIVDTLEVGGALLSRLPWIFDVQYWLVARFAPTRALSRTLSRLVAGRRMVAAVAAHRADVVASTYPLATEILGELRLRGALAVPVVSAITDLAALRYWAHPGCDLHLVTHAESGAEVRALAGATTRVTHVRGLTSRAFESPPDADAARAAFGVPHGTPVVVVSGGGWAVGDLEGAIRCALQADAGAVVLALCGRSAAVRRRLDDAFAGEPRVRTLGFTDRMSDVMVAADVLVHSTAGLTVLEALVRGTRVISYGWGVGHIRINNRAYERFGLAEVVAHRDDLQRAVRAALDAPRAPDAGYAGLPDAAACVLELGGG